MILGVPLNHKCRPISLIRTVMHSLLYGRIVTSKVMQSILIPLSLLLFVKMGATFLNWFYTFILSFHRFYIRARKSIPSYDTIFVKYPFHFSP